MARTRTRRKLTSAPGIRTIAEELGISVATVHRALHNQGRVSQKTRERVLRVADKIGYKPNIAARDLRLNRRFRFLVLLPLGVPAYFDALRSGIMSGAAAFRAAVDVEYKTETSPARMRSSLLKAIGEGFNGIITVPANTAQMKQAVREARASSTTIVFVSTDAPESGRLTAVTAHPYYCGRMAAEALAGNAKARGHIIVVAGNLQNLNQTEKIRGFRTMLEETAPALSVSAVLETQDVADRAFKLVYDHLQKNRVAGLYVSSANSLPVLKALKEARLLGKVPIVTTDLFPQIVPFLRDGTVTATVHQSPELQGSIAITTLYRFLQEDATPPSFVGVTPQLVSRSNLDLYLDPHSHEPERPWE